MKENKSKKKDRKKRLSVGSEIEYQRGDRRDKKFMVNYSFHVDKRSLPFSHIRLVSEPSSWK